MRCSSLVGQGWSHARLRGGSGTAAAPLADLQALRCATAPSRRAISVSRLLAVILGGCRKKRAFPGRVLV